jgi:hypothetical protein
MRARSFFSAMAVFVAALLVSSPALAAVSNATGTNVQDGSNRATTNQRGTGKSGDAVGGQVSGVVSSGRTSVDARNTSSNSDVTSGDVTGDNHSASFTGLNANDISGPRGTDVTNSDAVNLQNGDNRYSLTQAATLSTGDGVAGQVIGAVTAAGGSTSIVAANRSDNVDVTTGDAKGGNDAHAFTGQNAIECEVTANGQGGSAFCPSSPALADISNSSAVNLQDGNNRQTSRQSANASTGDGVAGQVIGSVSGGRTSIDANNSSTDVSVDTGDANANNDLSSFVGQDFLDCEATSNGSDGTASCGGDAGASDVTNSDAANVQDGNNSATQNQSANATSGDGVAGEVIGAVTSAGGSTSIVAANTSADSDVSTGNADAANDATSFVGQDFTDCEATVNGSGGNATCESANAADVVNADAVNLQDGDNRATQSQSANAATGDGVAGQVIGAVSAGATSIDATNTSRDVSIDTGDADATNGSDLFVGQNALECEARSNGSDGTATCGGALGTVDVSSVTAVNVQDGNNRATASQAANATSGDGVGGQVIGAVTSAGGSASVVAANTPTYTDITTGDADASNDLTAFVGLNATECDVTVNGSGGVASCPSIPGIADIDSVTGVNVQDGNNRLTGSQRATSNTGDGVGGQVLGLVSSGAASLDATNRTDDSSVETGDADSSNALHAFVGLNATSETAVINSQDTSNVSAENLQDGNNTKTMSQSADASSGDGVAGQVAGVVTSAGGSASVVLANTSTGIDSTTGESRFDNSDNTFVGLNLSLDGDLAL